jgi:signal transduction histidine kinase/HD-like signal output (HDOD) protein
MTLAPTNLAALPPAFPHGPSPQDDPRSRQVELILESVDSLPTLSPIATRLLSISAQDDADLAEITTIIESDPAMAIRILGLCKKADKGLGDKITTVRRAVVMLGLGAVRTAALSVSVFDLLGAPPKTPKVQPETNAGYWARVGPTPPVEDKSDPRHESTFDRTGFWKHSVGVACAAEILAASIPSLRVRPEEAFLAGLLHAIGKPTLDHVLPRAYSRVLALAERQSSDSAPIERSMIGLDHHTAGKRAAEHWGLSTLLREVMWLHAQPYASLPDTDARPLIALVTLAKAICRHLHVGFSADFGPVTDVATLCAQMKLVNAKGQPLVKVPDVSASLHAAVAERLRILGLTDTSTPQLLMESLAAANRQLGKLSTAAEDKARHAIHLSRALEAIAAFHAQPSLTLAETFASIARSAASLVGAGLFGGLFQPDEHGPWQLVQCSAEGVVLRAEVVEPPSPARSGASLAQLTDPAHLSVTAMSLLPWLADYLTDASDLRKVRLVPLPLHAPSDEPRPAAVLFTDRELSASTPGTPALLQAWGSAIAHAARHTHSQRLGERLAQLNRSLTEAQARLTEAESLARLGEVTAGAAHEMNNPLTVISGHAQLLASRLDEAKDRAAAQQIVEASESLNALIATLHTIAEPPSPSTTTTPLQPVIAEAVELASLRLGSPANVRVSLQVQSWRLDPRLTSQTLAELLVNALHADPTGPITLTAEIDAFDDSLALRVRDQGPGFSTKALRHAFDPFFSEKTAGRSHGLGLTRARSLAEAVGGRLTIQNASPKGALATLHLPRA